MDKRKFTPFERYGVFTAHGEKCWMCGKMLDLASMEVDHVIPESLLERPEELARVLHAFGLPPDFDLQSYQNWLPSCRRCNGKKLAEVFEATPLIQGELKKAREKAPRAKELADKIVGDREVAKAWSVIERAAAAGTLTADVEKAAREFFTFSAPKREPELASQPLRLAPLIVVLSEKDGIRIARGPYGVGGGPIEASPQASCGSCGHAVFKGRPLHGLRGDGGLLRGAASDSLIICRGPRDRRSPSPLPERLRPAAAVAALRTRGRTPPSRSCPLNRVPGADRSQAVRVSVSRSSLSGRDAWTRREPPSRRRSGVASTHGTRRRPPVFRASRRPIASGGRRRPRGSAKGYLRPTRATAPPAARPSVGMKTTVSREVPYATESKLRRHLELP